MSATSLSGLEGGRVRLGVCYVAVDVLVPSSKGSSTHVTEVAGHLRELGVDVVVLSRRVGFSQRRMEVFQGYPVYRVHRGIIVPIRPGHEERAQKGEKNRILDVAYRTYLASVLALYCGFVAARLIKKYNLNVVMERETSQGAGAIASLLTGRPLVLEVNGPRFSPLSSSRASVITAYSYSMVGERFRKKTRIVDSGVNIELFKPDPVSGSTIRARLGLTDARVVGYVGTFQRWHGLDSLVRASNLVLQAQPGVKFLMVGPGFQWIQSMAEELGVGSSFIFTGPVPHDKVARANKTVQAMPPLKCPDVPHDSRIGETQFCPDG